MAVPWNASLAAADDGDALERARRARRQTSSTCVDAYVEWERRYFQAKAAGGKRGRDDTGKTELRKLEGELEQLIEFCQTRDRDEATRAIEGLREALLEAERHRDPTKPPDAGEVGGNLEAALGAARTAVTKLAGRAAEGRFEGVESEAKRAVELLEVAVRGTSCEEEFGNAVRAVEMGSPAVGIELLGRAVDVPCLTKAGSEGARTELRRIADRLFAADGTTSSDPIRSRPAPARLQLAKLLARFRVEVPAVALAALEKEVEPPPSPAAEAPGGSTTAPETRPEPRVAEAAGSGARPVPPAATPVPKPGAAAPVRAGTGPVQNAKPAPSADAAPAGVAPPSGAVSTEAPGLALDVWQSAWGDFSEFATLGPYLRRNGIAEVYLNPGIAMGPGMEEAGARRLAPLLKTLRASGVRRFHLLYAELNFPVEQYAIFLKKHPELGIRHLADDSEFTDASREAFERNFERVRAHGIAYSAFVTVEAAGNSGVSDATRRWAIEHLDEAVLMSYLDCDLPGQKARIGELLAFADAKGKRRSVKIAILMGGKSVGRETSCERILDAEGMQQFLRGLHDWARKHPSYGGIVIETNRRMPGYDIAPSAR